MASDYPLAGIKVLDLTQYVAGPYGSQILADLGATVLKVERPGTGDVYRNQGPTFVGEESVSFLALNRGKRSIALDLRDDADAATARALAAEADVLVENMRPGTLAKFGLDYPTLSQSCPELVYCSISGFGQEGPLAGEGAYDLTMQALSGLLSLNGHPGGEPAKIPVAALDFGTGMYGVIGILAALRRRDRTGRGDWVKTSLLETSLAWLSMHVASYLAGGEEPAPMGTRSPFFAPYELYRTADGSIVVVGTGGNRGWEQFCEAIGSAHLVDAPAFATNSDRVRNAEALKAEIERVLTTRPTEHWIAALNAAGVPNAPVRSVPEVLDSEQVRSLDMVRSERHPTAGPVSLVRLPVTFAEAAATAGPLSPALDEHRDVGFREDTGGG